ncbi:isoprenyl transferase [Reichenbachiella sp. MALMAid0571]|uniref:isoprenyl transferase n=1 Tax=Reichenbachiella sp. MALMAid0571 TaxID=3143939 RepID=UPI0032DF948E
MQEKIDLLKIPNHIAIIMDGNGRWAKSRGASRIFGHKNAITAVRETTEGCAELGVKFLTLYAFSTENWNRPKSEVDGLMSLLVSTITKEIPTLMKNNVRLQPIGNISHLPEEAQKKLKEGVQETSNNDGMTLMLALNYSGRQEICDGVKALISDINKKQISLEDISESLISQYLYTKNIPDPELMIRTSGEMRVSNFLLWQMAYTEFYFTDILWPDFRKSNLHEAIVSYQARERRFGKTSEQLLK